MLKLNHPKGELTLDNREKLIDLMIEAKKQDPETVPCSEWLAEYLIAHGVVVQQWIPVTERLPERTLPPKDVLVYHDLGCGMFVDRAWYSYDKKRWCSVLGMKLKVTHWVPLPEPPKEEQK